MSLLTIATAVFDEVQTRREDTIVGSTRPAAQRALRYANSVGKELAEAVDWQALRREHTFTAIAGQTQTGILPSDFARFVPETFYDRTNYRFVSGPVTPQQWQALESGPSESGGAQSFAYRNGAIYVFPDMSGGENLAFEYITTEWCERRDGTGREEFIEDTDESRIDEELLTLGIALAWLDAESLPSGHIQRRYMKRLRALTKHDQPMIRTLPAGDIFASRRQWSGMPSSNGGFDIRSGY